MKLVIADDEYIIREGIASIPWNMHGIQVAGIAENGLDALAMIRAVKPEILLTDIRMPGISGIELIKLIKQEYPNIKSILLTGYKDFEYAKAAISLGTLEYILKPTDPQDVIDSVIKAKKIILEENGYEETNKAHNKSMLDEKYFLDLLYGRIFSGEEIEKNWKKFAPDFINYILMTIEMSSSPAYDEISEEQYSFLKDIVKTITEKELSKENYRWIAVTQTRVCFLVEVSAFGNDIKEKTIMLAQNINNVLTGKFNIFPTIGISRACKDIKKISKLFNETIECLNMKFSLGNGCIVHREDIQEIADTKQISLIDDIYEIIDNVKIYNYSLVKKLTQKLLYSLSLEKWANEKIIKETGIELIVLSLKLLSETTAYNREFLNELNFYEIIDGCKTLDKLSETVIDILIKIMDAMNTKIPANNIISRVQCYIEENYMKDISLISTADFVYLNPIYLSRLLKKEKKHTFLEILTNHRMNRACELLKNPNFKTYEISQSVGIKDSRYFAQLFKKHYGVTPTEFRNSVTTRMIDKVE